MYPTKEKTIAINKSLEHSERKLDNELKKTKIYDMNYEKWFLIHSGMKKEEDLEISINKNKSSQYGEWPLKKNATENSEEKNNLPDRTIFDYSIWFDRHSTKSEIKEIIYTSICKKYYPLILAQVYENIANICIKDSKRYSYFCFTCDSHFCCKCKSDHMNHSFINLDEIKINEEELINERNSVQKKISSIFDKYLEKKLDNNANKIIKKSIDELIKFNYYVINSYRKGKSNFYNYFNYYYLLRLKKDLKNKSNNLIKKFFGLHGFKTIINDLKYY